MQCFFFKSIFFYDTNFMGKEVILEEALKCSEGAKSHLRSDTPYAKSNYSDDIVFESD